MERARSYGLGLEKELTRATCQALLMEGRGTNEALGPQIEDYPSSGVSAGVSARFEPHADSPGCGFERMVIDFFDGLLDDESVERVDDHLASCHSCQMLILQQVQPSKVGGGLSPAGGPYTFSPGTWVGRRYQIIGVLGRGGMGEVYEAFDSLLEESIALKTLLATDCDDSDGLLRLLAEARIGRRVLHPNVCRTHDVGLHNGDHRWNERFIFVTMELIRGETLSQRLRRCGPLHATEARLIGGEILDGLIALHRESIIHRDVKCANVILDSGSKTRRRTALVDFGLAVDGISQQSSALRSRSPARAVEGTVAYMAPEQLAGLPVTPATDVYGFGATMFEVLTGCCPFVESRPGAREYPNALAMELLSACPFQSEPLRQFLQACLSPHPSTRFEDAIAARHAFDALW